MDLGTIRDPEEHLIAESRRYDDDINYGWTQSTCANKFMGFSDRVVFVIAIPMPMLFRIERLHKL